ncbi:APC family permease [Rhodococcus oryzae]|uniref:APC family permease n=1 Tax=Rhodococcus oryzae TaxID=2571143 RepID=A0ABY2RDA7_9NOCA|nr:APC family permease [Rhodococcus oryzae]TJZ73448.1 APC family permease [Rhodococcus oryzae]
MTALADAIARSFSAVEPERPAVSPLRALGRRRLSGTEVLAQAIATTAPAASMVLLPVTMLTHETLLAGLITIVVATVAVSLIAACVSQFTRRLAAAGGLYSFVFQGLGTRAALTTGVAMLAKYLGSGALTMYHGGQALIALLAELGLQPRGPWVAAVYLTVAAVILAALVRGVRFAALAILTVEVCSLMFIAGLMMLSGSSDQVAMVDNADSTRGVMLVVLTALFALAGFESATFFGPEAKRPLVTVTRTVLLTPMICGAMFIFAAWAAWSGRADTVVNAYLHGTGTGVSPAVVIMLNLGLSCSWLASSMASSNAASRLAYSMGIERVLPGALAAVHSRLRTPWVALSVIVATVLSAAMAFAAFDAVIADVKVGVRCALIIAYLLVTVASLRFLHRIRELTLPVVCAGWIGGTAAAATLGYIVGLNAYDGRYWAGAAVASVVLAGAAWQRHLRRSRPGALAAVGVFDSPESAEVLPGSGALGTNARGAIALVGADRTDRGGR